jgi:hypothetical protein
LLVTLATPNLEGRHVTLFLQVSIATPQTMLFFKISF